MALERSNDNVWRQQKDVGGVADSPEDELIARQEAKEREDRLKQAAEKLEKELGAVQGDEEDKTKNGSE